MSDTIWSPTGAPNRPRHLALHPTPYTLYLFADPPRYDSTAASKGYAKTESHHDLHYLPKLYLEAMPVAC